MPSFGRGVSFAVVHQIRAQHMADLDEVQRETEQLFASMDKSLAEQKIERLKLDAEVKRLTVRVCLLVC